jgi:7-carboxy-7-deazaguanine synthase
MKTYTINEIFCAPQGEGVRAGTINVFVRFSGCNLQCRVEPGPLSPGGFDCDTEFTSGRKLVGTEILQAAMDAGGQCRSVIFTGGEPGLQLDADLVAMFRGAGWFTAIETNGTVDVAPLGLDWISCSPKVAEHALRLREASELRYVRAHGQGIPRPATRAQFQLLSPAFDGHGLDRRHLDWCVQLCKENPGWRLSVQMHKVWGCR